MLNICCLKEQYQKNISFRYLSIASIFLIVIQLTFGATQSYRFYKQIVNRLKTKVQSKMKIVQTIASEDILNANQIALEKVLKTINEDSDITYSVIVDQNQQLIAYAIKPENSIFSLPFQPPDKQNISLEYLQKISKHESIIASRPTIYSENEILGEVWIGYSLKNTHQDLLKFVVENLITAIFIGILFAGMTHIIFAREILAPIKKLKALAKDIAGGKLGTQIIITRVDEIGELNSALNIMAWQLQQNLGQLKIARDEALIAERAKSQFMSKMSHELRSPLNAIIGFTQVMQHDSQISIKHQEQLTIIEQNSLHLLNLINDVLNIKYIDSGKSSFNRNIFNLYDFLQSLEQMFKFKAKEKKLGLLFKYEEGIPQYIETDEDKLRQILFNILDNSINLTDQGIITLTIKGKRDPENDYDYILYFKIIDPGRGIPLEQMHNLLRPFAQTENSLETTNEITLGLSMAQQLVELIGGDINIKSQINQGTVVRFLIPIIEPDISEANTQQYLTPKTEQLEPDSIESQFFYSSYFSYKLTNEKLADMDLKWLLKLRDATTKVDNKLILQTLEQIPADHEDLRQALLDLVEDFSYDYILDLTDKALEKINN